MKKARRFLKSTWHNIYIWFKVIISKPITYTNAKIDNLPIKITNYKLKKDRLDLSKGDYNTIVVHHTGSIPRLTIDKLYNVHVIKRKFAAIGYHFVIKENGEIFYTRPLRFKGAHAVPNSRKIGIAFASNFNWEKPTKKAFESYLKLVKVLRRRFNIPKENIIGHVQQQVRNLNENLRKYNVPTKLTGERMLKVKSLNELKAIKKYEYKRLKKLKVTKKLLPLARCLKACPGLQFYKHL